MRVLLADDHAQVRWALRTVIGEEPGLTVVGEVSDAENLISQAQALHPDLILLDWEMAGPLVDDLLSSLHALKRQPRVIVLSQRPESEATALAAGSDAFVSKADPPERLLSALRRLVRR